MFPSLPILVFGAVFMMWSRASLAPAKKAAPEKDDTDNKIIVKIVSSNQSAE